MADTKHAIQGYFHVDHRHQVHKGKPFPTHLLCPEKTEDQGWSRSYQNGPTLNGRGLWVGHIGRYVLLDGEWTKRHHILNVPAIFNLPYTEDGNTTKTEQYSLTGLLCHSGNAHQHGHFYAVYAYIVVCTGLWMMVPIT